MGVPALFRWLSKKYPKIIYPVEEEDVIKVQDEEGKNVVIPVNISQPNPNGTEFDNLYLDMNGIVHPCTHPEGKPAPETEEMMMVEIFKYTERIVSMIRPRKLLFMAIDGVAPRAKMNQQRSRRFRSAQEAREKEEARKEAVAMWEAMGKEITDRERTKESWDSNAITPGTPFMDLLASSLRYWVVLKMNTDPGWKGIQVIISDAGVPGEGEHKIMDFIRRQRTNPGHNPNTSHVIYGLDADLIMLALATHEPCFRVLREDVFFQDGSSTACRICGQEGHYAAQCTGVKAEIKKTPPEEKPFIFLDVAVLREYLEVELNVPQAPFPFTLEQAIDDWVLLIFFVGNDFLPHLPSLEIREGAIDTLLKIWKQELPRMGGYLTNHGQIELSRAQIILEGLAKREDEIFRRRREAEERQDSNAKRRKLATEDAKNGSIIGPAPSLQLTVPATAPTVPPVHPSLPQRPTYDFAAKADSIGFGAPPTAQSVQNVPTATQALAGSNRDVVANRRAIRMANMSAADVLKAEMSGLAPVKLDLSLPPKPMTSPEVALPVPPSSLDASKMSFDSTNEVRGLDKSTSNPRKIETIKVDDVAGDHDMDPDAEGEVDPDIVPANNGDVAEQFPVGVKRKHDQVEGDSDDSIHDDDEAPAEAGPLAVKVNADDTVEQEDTVKLWEPGYKERYYSQKFGVESNDVEFRKKLTKAYVEGLVWVLHYYYQGTPSWQWYFPYHFAPFAADFTDVAKMNIKFDLGQPFKPFEQLMGVFPASSRKHIPRVFHSLMTDADSPIIDFYPSTFEIDMNGKKMAWQGVALLPFIDQKRLLDAMATEYPNLAEEEVRRNRWGTNVVFAADEHPLYPSFELLYAKRKSQDPVPIDTKLSKGINGTVLRNPDCLPGSTYYSPLTSQDLQDIKNDRSLSVLYFFPKQLSPHRSILLPGVKRPPRTLSSSDLEITRNGGRGRGRGGLDNGRGGWDNGRSRRGDRGGPDRGNPYPPRPTNYGENPYRENPYNNDRGYGGRGSGSFQQAAYSAPGRPPYQPQSQGYGGYGGSGRPPQNYGGHSQYGYAHGGVPPVGGASNYASYGSSYGGYGSNSSMSGGYGGYGNSAGYGGYGQLPVSNGYGSHSGGMRGSASYNSSTPRATGRGRGW